MGTREKRPPAATGGVLWWLDEEAWMGAMRGGVRLAEPEEAAVELLAKSPPKREEGAEAEEGGQCCCWSQYWCETVGSCDSKYVLISSRLLPYT